MTMRTSTSTWTQLTNCSSAWRTTVPSAGVIEYRGKRGVTFRIKYRDADGKQVMETVGAEQDGMTRKQAAAVRRQRLVAVEQKEYRKPSPVTFRQYAETWFEESQGRRGWKPATVDAYRNGLDRLEEVFGSVRLAKLRPRDVAAYVRHAMTEKRAKTGKPLSGKTVNLDLTVLRLVLSSAKREQLIGENPCEGMERPKTKRRRWRILEPDEVARVAKAFTDERARAVFLVLMLTAVRNFEVRALKWRDADLVDAVLRVRDSKTETGERLIALSPAAVEALA